MRWHTLGAAQGYDSAQGNSAAGYADSSSSRPGQESLAKEYSREGTSQVLDR